MGILGTSAARELTTLTSRPWGRVVAAFAVIFVGLAGRAVLDKILALRGGPEFVALWAQLQSVVDLTSGVALSGIGTGLTVMVAQATQPDTRRNLLRSALLLGLATSFPAMLLIGLAAAGLSAWLTGGALPPRLFALSASAGWITVVSGLLGAYWLGHRRLDRVLLLALATTLPLVAVALTASSTTMLQSLILAQIVPALFITAVLIWYVRTHSHVHGGAGLAAPDRRQLARYLPVGLAIGTLTPASILLVRSIVSNALSWSDAGLIQALWRSSDWITSVAAGVLALLFLPRFSAAHGTRRFAGELVRAGSAILIPAAVLLFLLLLNQKTVLATLYDTRFVLSDRAAAFFLMGDWIRIASWVFLYALFAMRRTVAIMAGEIFSLPLFAFLLYVFSDGLTLERTGIIYLLTYLSYFVFNAAATLRKPDH